MRILVCGGRDFKDRDFVVGTLERMAQEDWPKTPPDQYGNWLPMVTIIEGGADGVDRFAAEWAIVNWTCLSEFPAQWHLHGKAAGPIRNQKMLDEGKPDLVVAFPGGRGTADMVRRAKAAGVKVMEVPYEKVS